MQSAQVRVSHPPRSRANYRSAGTLTATASVSKRTAEAIRWRWQRTALRVSPNYVQRWASGSAARLLDEHDAAGHPVAVVVSDRSPAPLPGRRSDRAAPSVRPDTRGRQSWRRGRREADVACDWRDRRGVRHDIPMAMGGRQDCHSSCARQAIQRRSSRRSRLRSGRWTRICRSSGHHE